MSNPKDQIAIPIPLPRNLLLHLPAYVRLLCTQYLSFQDVLSLDTATHQKLIAPRSCPLWMADATFRSRWALQWAVRRGLQLRGYKCELDENSCRQTNIFVILPIFHQLCLEGGSSLELAAALVTHDMLVPLPRDEEGCSCSCSAPTSTSPSPGARAPAPAGPFGRVGVNALAQYGDAVSLLSQSPLHAASGSGRFDTVRLLVLAPLLADVNVKDGYDATPLHSACAAGQSQVTAFLLENGADPCRQRIDLETPLHRAVRGGTAGHQQCVLLLLAWGSDPSIVNSDGSNTLHTAVECNQQDCCIAIVRSHTNKQLFTYTSCYCLDFNQKKLRS